MELRNRGIYRLPNGRELVALVSLRKTPLLYRVGEGDRIQYALNDSGRLTFQGRLTAWSVEDLLDTGKTENDWPGADVFDQGDQTAPNSQSISASE
jgi:hypothetical protein